MKKFKPNKKNWQLHSYEDEQLVKAVEAHCIKVGMSKSEFVRRACYEKLERERK